MNIESDFREAMRNTGIETDADLIADGHLHRFHVEGDRHGSRNGWYVLHDGNHPAAAFGCNKRGITCRWRASQTQPLSQHDRAQIEADRKARAIEQERAYSASAERAGQILRAATLDSVDHAYVERKRIRTFGVKQNSDGVLVRWETPRLCRGGIRS